MLLMVQICVCSTFGEKEGVIDIMRTDTTPNPTPKPTLTSYTTAAESCSHKNTANDAESALLGPPETKLCTNILQDMQDGDWVYGMDHICKSSDPKLNVLCSNNRTVGYAKVDRNKPGAVWRPNHCSIKIYSAADACALLTGIGKLVIAGESFQRHTYQGMLNVLTGDYQWGSVKCESRFQECKGEHQYNEKACSSSYRVGPIAGCGPNRELVSYETYTQYAYKKLLDGDHGWHTIFGSLTDTSMLLMGYGMHDALNAEENDKYAIGPIVKFVKALPAAKRPHIVWQSVHAQGALKPKKFLKTQGNRPVREYNKKMARVFHKYGMPVFDVFNMTFGAFSFDGAHYGMTVNVLRAQLLLNYIAEVSQKDHQR